MAPSTGEAPRQEDRHAPFGRPGPRRLRRRPERGDAAAEAETGVTCLLIADIDRAFGPTAGLELVERLVELRRSDAIGMDRVIGVGMDSTERGIDPLSFRPAFEAAHAAEVRLTAHQGEISPAGAIAACIDVLGVERIDHGLSILGVPLGRRRVRLGLGRDGGHRT